jgi:hypothetical protein
LPSPHWNSVSKKSGGGVVAVNPDKGMFDGVIYLDIQASVISFSPGRAAFNSQRREPLE